MDNISMPREELLTSLNITTDEVLELFPRDTLLSALGFDTTGDFLDEVTLRDVMEYYDHNDIVDHLEIDNFWDIDDAYNRYGSELIEYFEDYRNTSDWSASDYIEDYGDSGYLLGVLLDEYTDVEDLYEALSSSYKEKLGELLKPRPNIKHSMLEALLKVQYNTLKDSQ